MCFAPQSCFAPQGRALFQQLNIPKCSEAAVFCKLWLQKSTSCHNPIQFVHVSSDGMVPHLPFWQPYLRPSRTTKHWKHTVFCDFSTFLRILTLSLLWLLPFCLFLFWVSLFWLFLFWLFLFCHLLSLSLFWLLHHCCCICPEVRHSIKKWLRSGAG